MSSVLIIDGHPSKDSFCNAQAQALARSLMHQKHKVKLVRAFDYPLISQHVAQKGFPSEFEEISSEIPRADFIAVVYPMWNFSLPGGLKNFLDGAFQARKSFVYKPHKILSWLNHFSFFRRKLPAAMPQGLLKAQKALIICTADAPKWYFCPPWKNAGLTSLKALFRFSGVKKIETQFLGGLRDTTEKEREKWLEELEFYKWK